MTYRGTRFLEAVKGRKVSTKVKQTNKDLKIDARKVTNERHLRGKCFRKDNGKTERERGGRSRTERIESIQCWNKKCKNEFNENVQAESL